MIAALVTGAGMALVVEGLALALLPRRLEDLVETFARMPLERRRVLGLAAVALGVAIVWAGLPG